MPFPMIHLYVAKQVATEHKELIKSLPQFYLGVLSPDSIHFRDEFIANDKKVTHLCVSDEGWGYVTNNAEWTQNVLSFLDAYKDTDDFSFVFGYCVHIISDIYNNIYIWTPYRLDLNVKMDKYYGGSYHKANGAVDFRLADEFKDKKEIWELLEKAKAITIPGIVNAEDIERLKANILYKQYESDTTKPTESGEYTYKDALNIIEKMTSFVTETLKQTGGQHENLY